MPFTCSICGEESARICARCTKDACDNHLCEKCLRCSDCCECNITLADTNHTSARAVVEAVHARPAPAAERPPTAERTPWADPAAMADSALPSDPAASADSAASADPAAMDPVVEAAPPFEPEPEPEPPAPAPEPDPFPDDDPEGPVEP